MITFYFKKTANLGELTIPRGLEIPMLCCSTCNEILIVTRTIEVCFVFL